MLILGVAVLCGATGPGATADDAEELAARIEMIAAQAGGRVGLAASLSGSDATVMLDGEGRYPMQSVYKLPIAMAALRQVDSGGLDLAQVVRIERTEFVSDTQHSPIRDRHPHGCSLALEEILRLAVAESDGTASDVILHLLGGPERVMEFLNDLGIAGIQVIDTEKEIGRDDAVQYRNWATPAASVELLRALQEGHGLSPASRALILRWMTETKTGKRRIKALLPAGPLPHGRVAHKTGSSRTVDGVTAATNDIGLVTLPDGRHFAIAVYISDSKADDAVRDRVIAEIARTVWNAWIVAVE